MEAELVVVQPEPKKVEREKETTSFSFDLGSTLLLAGTLHPSSSVASELTPSLATGRTQPGRQTTSSIPPWSWQEASTA